MVESRRRSKIWRSGEYLGLVTDKAKPKVGSAAWWRTVSLVVVFVTAGLVLARLL